MNRDEFFEAVVQLIDFADERARAYREGSDEHGIWRRVSMAFEQAKSEIPE